MRVTLNAAVRDAQAQLQRAEEQMASRTRELASGRRLNSLSDDPSSSVGAIISRAQVGRIDSYARATDSVEARLSIVDSVFSDVITQLTGALTATIAARGTEVQPGAREAYAISLEGYGTRSWPMSTPSSTGHFFSRARLRRRSPTQRPLA